tara:strand:- start:1346 stop:2251 length:906 start_codon:yes stop_codon:yes gene_type:complete
MDIKILGEIGYDVNAIEVIEQIQSSDEEITMHMLSGGGSAIHGFGIYDAMKASANKITVKIYGFSASAASVIAMGADVIEMGEGALMMIHEASGGQFGTADELRGTAEVLDAFNSRLVQVYHNRTGIEKDVMAEMINKNEWMSVDQAIELGFADAKLESFEVAASANLLLTKTKKENSIMSESKAEAIEPVAVVQEIKTEVKAVEPVAVAEVVDDKADLKKYMSSFGKAEGAEMFADGVSFEAAQQLHITSQSVKIEELEAKLAEQSILIEAGKKAVGGEALALGAVEPKKQSKPKIRFAD